MQNERWTDKPEREITREKCFKDSHMSSRAPVWNVMSIISTIHIFIGVLVFWTPITMAR